MPILGGDVAMIRAYIGETAFFDDFSAPRALLPDCMDIISARQKYALKTVILFPQRGGALIYIALSGFLFSSLVLSISFYFYFFLFLCALTH